MSVQCLKRPCAIFDELEPVRKIRLIDRNFKNKYNKARTDQGLYLSDNITAPRPRQTTCLGVTPKRKSQLQPDEELHTQCCTFVSSPKKAKMVIQARDPTSVDICGSRNDQEWQDHVAGLGGVCFESGDPVSGRPSRGRGLERSDGICSKSTAKPKPAKMDTSEVTLPIQDTSVETPAGGEDDAAVFSCFSFWRLPVPEVDLLEELSLERREADGMEAEGMEESDDSAAMSSDDDNSLYSDFSFWKIPMEVIDLD